MKQFINEPDSVSNYEFTSGFRFFVGLMALPAFVSLVIFIGAALVAPEVHAADARNADTGFVAASTLKASRNGDVASWKRTLVGICPLH